MTENGMKSTGCGRAEVINDLLEAVQDQLIAFIRAADRELDNHKNHHNRKDAELSVVDHHTPSSLQNLLLLELPKTGLGASGLVSALRPILAYSVNTFSPGFLDKLYSSTNAPGIAAELVLSVLNTNVHVYQVSPVLTLVEKHTTKALASLFGLTGPRKGGVSVQGGSASNMTSIVIARNTLYPATKLHGNAHGARQLVLFTSAHGHYSIEKAAQACGFGSVAVIPVPVDPATGSMIPSALESLIIAAKGQGKTPFYVNATAGTTVLGSFDPFNELAKIARKHSIWFHIDASWGGPFIFSSRLKHKLDGAELADSIAINPHKMMGVPITCSFLLSRDLRKFHRANTLPAGYLFHGNRDGEAPNGVGTSVEGDEYSSNANGEDEDEQWDEPDDLADLTLQCGRRGDSLKLFLSWLYYGSTGYAAQVENAYATATYLADLVDANLDLILVSENPPPCLQVCFYFAPSTRSVFGNSEGQIAIPKSSYDVGNDLNSSPVLGRFNSMVTEQITKGLVERGFMIDFAPALEGREADGKFFRVVVNVQTIRETVERLVTEITELGMQVRDKFRHKYAECQDDYLKNGTGAAGGPLVGKQNPTERGHGSVVRQCRS